MAIKTFINGQENGVITFSGNTEPCAVYVNGERQDNISYTPELIEGANSVEYSSEYKRNIRTMQIDGNTEQFQGTFAPQNITIPTSYVIPSSAPIIVSETPITVPNGARLTLTANKTGNGNISSLSSGFIVIISDSRDDIATNYTEILEDYGTPLYLATPKVSGEFYIGIANFLQGGIDNPQAYWDFLRANYTFTLSTEGNTAPNPDFPQPIYNANDNGMSLELRGTNLFNRPNTTLKTNNEYYKNLSGGGFVLQPNTTYTVAFDYEFISLDKTYLTYWGLGRGNTSYINDIKYNCPFPNFTKGRASYTFTTPSNMGVNNKLWLRIPRNDNRVTCEVSLSNFMLNYGEQALPFEPYFAPTTIAILPSVTVGSSTIPLRFAKVDDKADYIEVNRLDGTVKYVRNIAYLKLPHQNKTYTYIGMKGTQSKSGEIEQIMTRAKGICTHTSKVGNYVDTQAKNAMWVGVNQTVLYWIGILDTLGFTTVEEFNTWLDEQEAQGTPVELIYQLKTPVTTVLYDKANKITTDLGQALFELPTENQTNIITITSTPSVSKLSVNYAKYGGVI